MGELLNYLRIKNIIILSLLLIGLFSFILFILLSFSSQAASYGDINKNLEAAGQATGYDIASNYTVIIGRIIKTAIGIVGALFMVLIVYGGFLWMTAETSAGKNQIDKAKKIITYAIIGLIIITAAYAITSFVVSSIESAAQQKTEPVSLLFK